MMFLWSLMRRKCFKTQTMTQVKKHIYEKRKDYSKLWNFFLG